jgi:hypothetical protein
MGEPTFGNFASVIVLMAEMRDAADKAATDWLAAAEARGPKYSVHQADLLGNQGPAIGTMLDVCGNAWVELKDKRTKLYKAFKGAGYLTPSGNSVALNYNLRGRQEMGLHIAAAEAALKVLTDRGIKEARVHSYID